MAVSKGPAKKGHGVAKAGGRSAKGEHGHGGHGRGKKPTKVEAKKHKDDQMAKGKNKGHTAKGKTGGKTPNKAGKK